MSSSKSSDGSIETQRSAVELESIYQADVSSSSSEPSTDEWLSLAVQPPLSRKKMLHDQGLFDPGSGEVCAKYIAMSDSDVLRHLYYAYPAIKDPGILEALYDPEKVKVYNMDGQDMYIDLCEEMNLAPVRIFHRGLLLQEINLKYYGVNPSGLRAMYTALSYNTSVRRLDLTSNYLDHDACYHLGQLLVVNTTLTELVLCQCKIKSEGLKRLVVRLASRSMDVLDISRNDIGDKGFEYLSVQIMKGAIIKRLNLSYNDLSSVTAQSFTAAIEGNKSITHLDLSWNKLYSSKETNDLLRQLADSKKLTELYLSWNGLTVGIVLRRILALPELRILDLRHNKLSTPAAKAVSARLHMARKLQTLDLSHNPFTSADALLMLQKMREEEVVLKNLLMDDVIVTKEFVEALREILELSYRADTKVTHGPVIGDYTLTLPDLRAIIMKRLFFVTDSSKKCNMDMPLFFLKEFKEREDPKLMQPRELVRALKNSGAQVDEGLIDELTKVFPGPRLEKGGPTIQLAKVVEFIKRLWPEKQLPPTPPPVVEEIVVKKKKTKKRK